MHVSLDERVLCISCIWLLFEFERRNLDEKKMQSNWLRIRLPPCNLTRVYSVKRPVDLKNRTTSRTRFSQSEVVRTRDPALLWREDELLFKVVILLQVLA